MEYPGWIEQHTFPRHLIHLKASGEGFADHRAMPAAPAPVRTERLPFVAQVPFRSFFLIGIAQLLLAIGLWLVELGARVDLWPSPTPTWPAGVLHAASMLFGVFPFFVFGFSFNAFPKWHMRDALPPARYLTVALLLGAGWLCLYATVALALPPGPAFALLIGGWAWGWLVQLDIVRRPGLTPWHTRGVVAASGIGGIGLALLAAGLTRRDGTLIHAAISIGSWAYAAPLFFCVAQRVVPMFDGFVVPRLAPYQPRVGLVVMVASLVAHALLLIAGQPSWTAPADAIAALVLWQHVARWPLRAIWQQRVLAMLHVGFIWFAIALSLNVLSALAAVPNGGHALYLGAFGSLLFAMATRVTQGRAPDKARSEARAWTLFGLLQAAVLARIGADWLPVEAAPWGHLLAAGLFLGAFGVWAALNLRSYLR